MAYGKDLGLSRALQEDAGFTLVELLLALFLFALIAAVIFAAFAAVASGVEKGRQSMEFYRVGRTALLRMAQEIGAAMPPPDGSATTVTTVGSNPAFQGKKTSGGSGIGQDRVEFLTIPYRRYSDKVPAYELCRVAYYVADNQQGKTALFRDEDCSGEEDERHDRATRLELTDLAVGLEITYFDAEQVHEEWPPTRDAKNPLPCRVRLALTLRNTQQYERAFITTVALPMGVSCDAQRR